MDWYAKGEELLIQGFGDAHAKGYELVDRSKLKEAVDCFEKVLAEDPKHPKAMFNKGRALMGLLRFEEARNWVKLALVLLPEGAEGGPELWALKGWIEGAPVRLKIWRSIQPDQLQALKDLEHLMFTDYQAISKYPDCPAEYQHLYNNPYGFLVGSGVLIPPLKTGLVWEMFGKDRFDGVKVEENRIVVLGLNGKAVYSKLTTLPASFGQLVSLRALDLSHNQLTTLPASFGQLTALEKLDLGYNRFTSLPVSFGQLRALQLLELHECRLSALPESIGQLTALQALHLRKNQLTSLPKAIGQLTALKQLQVFDSQLTSLPASIGQLHNLESLFLSANQLTSLPASIGQLRNLESLSLSANQLTSLPASIGQLSALQTLGLSHNQLTSLPKSFGQLRNLESLSLYGNPWEGEWQTVASLEEDLDAILAFCRVHGR